MAKRTHLRSVDEDADQTQAHLLPGLTDPPPLLDDEALVEWERLAPALLEAGRLTVGTRDVLESYCDALVIRRRARAQIPKSLMKQGENRGKVKHPAVAIFRDWTLTVERLSKALGLHELGSSPTAGADPGRYLTS